MLITPGLLAVFAGLATGLTLIVAIGAQNAYLLREGLSGRNMTPLVLVSIASDVLLMGVGVAGTGYVLSKYPAAITVATWGGALFLLVYAAFAAKRALRSSEAIAMDTPAAGQRSLTRTLAICLAVVFLNPHAYLDAVVFVGSVANAQGEVLRWWFLLGASLASTIWFSALGFGAKRLARFFQSARAWRILDAAVAVVMVFLALVIVASAV